MKGYIINDGSTIEFIELFEGSEIPKGVKILEGNEAINESMESEAKRAFDNYEKEFSELLKQAEKDFLEFTENEDKEEDEKPKEVKESSTSKIDLELKFLKQENYTAQKISDRYNVSNDKKNGFSTTQLYKYLEGKGNPKEIVKAEYIYKKIK